MLKTDTNKEVTNLQKSNCKFEIFVLSKRISNSLSTVQIQKYYENDKKLPVSKAISDEKFVVLLCHDEQIARNLKSTLSCVSYDVDKVKIMSLASTAEAISNNLVAGVVCIGDDNNYRYFHFEREVCKILKDCYGWNDEMAHSAMLPNLAIITDLNAYKCLNIAFQMLSGVYHLARLRIPSRRLNIVVACDYYNTIHGLMILLSEWPNIELSHKYLRWNEPPKPVDANILLVDTITNIPNFTGGDLVRSWRSSGKFKGKVISFSNVGVVSYAHYYLNRIDMEGVARGYLATCHEFIALINQVIQDVEN